MTDRTRGSNRRAVPMASYRNENRPDSGDLLSWIITIVLLVSPVWPIGLILLL